jgi:rhodanese-related sulfurtransferase
MGNTPNYNNFQKASFEDVQRIACDPPSSNALLINNFSMFEQECLIKNSILGGNEEVVINNLLTHQKGALIIVYGKNTHTTDLIVKYRQLVALGFENVYIYAGGLFEWLCLQDIYGEQSFPTTRKEIDLLKYRPLSDIPKKNNGH